jgi:glycosyltransferase involved in cell wall biosynthesis
MTTECLTGQRDVSVVVSTRNRADVLGNCLRALAGNRATISFEVIVVDNGSTDGTREVVRVVAEACDVPLHYVWEPRQGVSYGRNAGIARAVGRVVAFTDDDIQVAADWVEQVYQLLERHPDVECVGGPVLPLWSEPPPEWLDSRHWSPLSVTDHGSEPFLIDASHPVCLLTSNLAFRRDVFDRVGGFSADFPRAQDHELQLRFWLSGGRELYSPTLVVHTAVPRERMRVDYHRRWHSWHGHMCARMRLRERTAPDGSIRSQPHRLRVIWGRPAFLWRELGGAVFDWFASLPGGDRAHRLDHEMHVRHLLGYIAEKPRISEHDAAAGGQRRQPQFRFRALSAISDRLLRRNSARSGGSTAA